MPPWIKTSLSPGSGVVTHYLEDSGVLPFLERLGFDVVGYGCMTCIGNSGPLSEPVSRAIEQVSRARPGTGALRLSSLGSGAGWQMAG